MKENNNEKGKTMKLSKQQIRMILAAKDRDNNPWGYAPCGRGFQATMKSLVKAGLALATGSDESPRGIVLTRAGREMAETLGPVPVRR